MGPRRFFQATLKIEEVLPCVAPDMKGIGKSEALYKEICRVFQVFPQVFLSYLIVLAGASFLLLKFR